MQNKKEEKHNGQKPLFNEFDETELIVRPKGMPSLACMQVEAQRMGLLASDGEHLYNNWLVSGYRTARGQKVRDWKAALRVWKANDWFPSQKKSRIKFSDSERERAAATFERLKREQRNGSH